ncbi:hypothetical protein K440DRAFT_613551 [Wilcoxina mikolae CBS 423.85]|nr:hypothetical protein K440DRAFT_613551 [Wilcoxina mikolae CBS 423.85]
MIPSLGDPVIISGPNETTSLNTVRLGSHSIGTKLFSGMFGKLTWGHHPTPTSSPRPNTLRDSADSNPSNEGISQTQEPQCSGLDGASKSEEARSHVNSPGITAVDLNAPTDTEKQPKKTGSLFSFPGYEAPASQKATAYFRYNPPSAMHKVSAGENSAGKDSATGNSSPHHQQDAPKQPENAPEAEQVHDSELWLDGTVSPTSEPSSGQNEPHCLTPVNNCSDTSSDGSDTPRASTEFENDPEDDWSGFDSGPLPSPPPSVVEEEEAVLDDEEYCVIKRPAVRELPVLLCPYCSCPLEDLAHACKRSAKEQQVATPKRPSPKKSRHLKSEVGKRKGPRLEAVQEEPGEGGGRMENFYNSRVQNLIPPASAMGGSVVMKKVPRQATDEKKRADIFERAWGGSGSERHHSNAYILARADLYS